MNELYEELKELLKQEKGVALATIVGGEMQVGANMLVYPNRSVRGTLGNAALEALVIEDAQQAIWVGQARTQTYSVESETGALAFDVFIEGYPPPPTLIIVGAGHIAIPQPFLPKR